MAFVRPLLSAIKARIDADFDVWLPGADSRLRFSVSGVLASILAKLSDGWHGHADWIARQILPDTAEAEFLARHAANWGVERKAAEAATGPVTVTGTDGTIIMDGVLLGRADGAQYRVLEAVAIAAGTATLNVEAQAAGPGGNAVTGQRLTFLNPISGVNAQALVAAPGVAGGADEESDASLLARLLSRVRTPPHGGTVKDYHDWALAVPGVTRVWVRPGWLGSGTVGVTFVMDDRVNIIPLAGDVDEVQDAIDSLRPVTAALTVFAPTPLPVPFSIRAVPPTVAVQDAITASLDDLFFREAAPGVPMLISHIREAISIAGGETDHELIVPLANVLPAPHEILTRGAISWV